MRNLTTILSILFLLTPATAHAKRIDKMSTGELISELKNSTKPERRVEATQRLAETGAREATATLGGICRNSKSPEALCVASIKALGDFGTSAALTHVQATLNFNASPASGRSQALAVLMRADQPRLKESIPKLFQAYSGISPGLLSELLVSARLLELTDLADAAVFIASDDRLELGARVSALDTAEHFGPPRLYKAHQALMRSKDSKVRARCAESLGAPGLPASEVVPLLKQVVQLDPEGYVRAAAINALAQYTHADLLVLLHERLRKERHPVGFQATLDLSLTLADESTSGHLSRLLDEHPHMKPEQTLLVVQKLAHLGDPQSIPAIFAVEQKHQGTKLAKMCRLAVTILESGEFEAQNMLEPIPNQPRVPTIPWDPESPDVQLPELAVESTADGLDFIR